jgi:DNA-binding CsgD family transcriptional regulator
LEINTELNFYLTSYDCQYKKKSNETYQNITMKNCTFSFLKCFLTFIFLVIVNHVEAQKPSEVLSKLINQKTTTPNEKFQYLCDLSSNYAEIDSIKGYDYANQAVDIAKQLNSLNKQIIAYDYLAIVARRSNNIRKQIWIADKCDLLAKDSKDEEVIAYCDFLMAYKYYIINDKEKYVYYILKSLSYFEKNKKRYDKLVSNYSNLGFYFGNKNNFNVCQKYLEKSYIHSIESKNDVCKANGLNNWANFVMCKARLKLPANKILLDSASRCFIKAIKIFESKNNYLVTVGRDYNKAYVNLASLYFYHFFDSNQEQTLKYLNKAQEVSDKVNYGESLMTIYGLKTHFYIKTGNISEAEKTIKKLESYANGIIKKEPIYRVRLYNSYLQLAELKNDFKDFLKYFDLYFDAKNDQNNKDNMTADFNASIRFEIEQKDKEIKSLTLISNERKKINYLLIVLSLLAFLTLIFMYKTYQYRRSAYIKENESRIKANEDEAISTMLELEIVNRERKIAIQEKILTDKQKEKLQHELMTHNLQLQNKNEILKEIQQKLALIKSSDLKPISRTINKSIEIDDEFELLKSNFESTNPEFFATLQEKSSNKLTKLDLKYCGYIKLGMGIKEMANIMNIEPKSMRMARYRIRQKLNLGKEDDLDDFINAI